MFLLSVFFLFMVSTSFLFSYEKFANSTNLKLNNYFKDCNFSFNLLMGLQVFEMLYIKKKLFILFTYNLAINKIMLTEKK